RPGQILLGTVVATALRSDQLLVGQRDDARELKPRQVPTDTIPQRPEEPRVIQQALQALSLRKIAEIAQSERATVLLNIVALRRPYVERVSVHEQGGRARKRMPTGIRWVPAEAVIEEIGRRGVR